jgi:exopolysaccharide biosynthesis WecB/TagA/CpsF family protein
MIIDSSISKADKEAILALLRQIKIAKAPDDIQVLLDDAQQEAALRPVTLAFVNPHAVNLCYQQSGFLPNLRDSNHIYRDGSGIKILFKMLGWDAGLNMNGTDLIPRIIDRYNGQRIALLGTSSPWLEKAGEIITARGGEIVAMLDGFQQPELYKLLAEQTKPALIILGMGMPKQEAVARYLKTHLTHPCLIISGGAVLDFMAGKVDRAPLILRRLGLEWIYRLYREPKRLFKRYVIGNLVFLYRGLSLRQESKQNEL